MYAKRSFVVQIFFPRRTRYLMQFATKLLEQHKGLQPANKRKGRGRTDRSDDGAPDDQTIIAFQPNALTRPEQAIEEAIDLVLAIQRHATTTDHSKGVTVSFDGGPSLDLKSVDAPTLRSQLKAGKHTVAQDAAGRPPTGEEPYAKYVRKVEERVSPMDQSQKTRRPLKRRTATAPEPTAADWMIRELGHEASEMSVREAGRLGSERIKEKYGPEFYSDIGHKGGQRVKELIEKGEPALDIEISGTQKGSPISEPEPMPPATAETESIGPTPPRPRHLQGRMPSKIKLGAAIDLLVRIALMPSKQRENEASVSLEALVIPPEGLTLTLALHSSDFTLVSEGVQTIHVRPDEDSGWVLFTIKAHRPGVSRVQVTAYNQAAYLGVLTLEAHVDAEITTGEAEEKVGRIGVRKQEDGEVTLQLWYDANRKVYRYQFIDKGFFQSNQVESEELMRTPSEAVEYLVAELNKQASDSNHYSSKATRYLLRGIGKTLWEQFIPEALRRELLDRQGGITRMNILSEGDPVPWELLFPKGASGAGAKFLIEQFPIARWIFDQQATTRIHASKPFYVLPTLSPPTAAAEIENVQGLLGKGQMLKDLDSLLDAINSGEFDVLHFACHNTFRTDSPAFSEIEMESERAFNPTLLRGIEDNFGSESPLVFMNACRSGGLAPNYTRMAGWAESFIQAGAGAFIGSLWNVRDSSASQFAQTFYQSLSEGNSLGNAMKQARESIQEEPGDPTWLAYTLYGDPSATLSRG